MAKNQRTVVGVFTDRRQADRAVDELRRAGFRNEQIGVAGPGTAEMTTAGEGKDTYAGEGAAVGAAVGAGLGGLVGLGIVAGLIPAIGPIIAGGTLAVILANAAGGAAIASLAGALIGLGIPEEEASYYEGEFRSGRTVVTVQADGRYDEAWAILQRHDAYSRTTAQTAAGTACTTAGQKVELREEQLHARKQPVQTGEVRVRKEVVSEQKSLEVPVQREEVVIERRPASGQAATGDIRAGEEIRIPVREEQVNVEKEAVVKEEVHVGKRAKQETEQVSGTVRKEELRVEREGDADVKQRGRGK